MSRLNCDLADKSDFEIKKNIFDFFLYILIIFSIQIHVFYQR